MTKPITAIHEDLKNERKSTEDCFTLTPIRK